MSKIWETISDSIQYGNRMFSSSFCSPPSHSSNFEKISTLGINSINGFQSWWVKECIFSLQLFSSSIMLISDPQTMWFGFSLIGCIIFRSKSAITFLVLKFFKDLQLNLFILILWNQRKCSLSSSSKEFWRIWLPKSVTDPMTETGTIMDSGLSVWPNREEVRKRREIVRSVLRRGFIQGNIF